MRTKEVECRFAGAGIVCRKVSLGEMATDSYFVENARAEIDAEHEGVGRFLGGRVVGEVA